MCGKIIETDENMMETLRYYKGEMPVIRLDNCFDDYRNGEMACHWHPEFQFGLLLRGELEYSFFQSPVSKIQRVIRPGEGFFINSRVLHSCRQLAAGTEIFTFGMVPGFFVSPLFGNLYQKIVFPILHSRAFGFFLSKEKKEEAEMLELYRRFHNLCPEDIDYELNSMELICRIWKGVFQRLNGQKSFLPDRSMDFSHVGRIHKMLAFIQTHYQEPLSVDQIAQAGEVSRRECFRCFRSLINQTPMEYLNQYRLSVAAHLLSSGSQPLASISESCGFENISYFTKLFKRRFGMTPGQFRSGNEG